MVRELLGYRGGIFSMDITVVISTFIGFATALLVNYLWSLFEKNRNIVKAIRNINDELKHLYSSYYDMGKKEVIKSDLYFVNTPIWDSIISSGDLLLILKMDKDYYDDVLAIYDSLKEIEQMQSADRIAFRKDIDDTIEDVIEQIINLESAY